MTKEVARVRAIQIIYAPLTRLLPHARGLGSEPHRWGFPSGAKKEWGLVNNSKFDPKKFDGYAPKKGEGQHIDGEVYCANSYNFQFVKIGLEAHQEAGPSQTEEANQEVPVVDLLEGGLDYLTIGDDDQDGFLIGLLVVVTDFCHLRS
ncbi:hypothetical protein Tco_1438671 [Tanacetum coccineum]